MITMTEIAKLTGVSQPTVSRVLNGNQAVNPEIRERVLACAREHNFQPNVIARSLAGSRTMLIGLVFTDISNSFFADLEKYLEQEAKKSGYSVILFNSDYDWNREKECLDVMRRYRVDGLILVPVEENSERFQQEMKKLDMPAVAITRKTSGMDCVYVDHIEAGGQVAHHLQQLGCEAYLFVGTKRDGKYEGFLEALKETEPDCESRLTRIETKNSEELWRILKQHFAEHAGRTGIFAYNDRRAIQIHGILQELGIEMPERASLVGFDNTYTCEFLYPGLSSVSQPNQEMAAKAVQCLLKKIEHPEERKIMDEPMQARLIVRGSSAGTYRRSIREKR